MASLLFLAFPNGHLLAEEIHTRRECHSVSLCISLSPRPVALLGPRSGDADGFIRHTKQAQGSRRRDGALCAGVALCRSSDEIMQMKAMCPRDEELTDRPR